MAIHSKQLEDTNMWKVYVAKLQQGNDHSRWLQEVYNASIIYLKDVRRMFPNYTLHDEQHVLNVLDSMSGILGSQIDNLSLGEIELLILAACMHDLGMVYSDEDQKKHFEDDIILQGL